MKFRKGDIIKIKDKRPEYCKKKCWKINGQCLYYNQIGVIRRFVNKHIHVIGMKEREGCTGCSGFGKNDMMKVPEKDWKKCRKVLKIRNEMIIDAI